MEFQLHFYNRFICKTSKCLHQHADISRLFVSSLLMFSQAITSATVISCLLWDLNAFHCFFSKYKYNIFCSYGRNVFSLSLARNHAQPCAVANCFLVIQELCSSINKVICHFLVLANHLPLINVTFTGSFSPIINFFIHMVTSLLVEVQSLNNKMFRQNCLGL